MENQGKSKDIGPEKQQFADHDGGNKHYEIGGGSGTKNLIDPDEEYKRIVAALPADLETYVEPAAFEVQPAAIPEAQVPTHIRQAVRGPGIIYMDAVYCPSINPMTTIHINVMQDLVPHIIGKRGSHSKLICEVAHVSLDISREPSSMKMITIAGGYREATTAARMVVELIDIIVQSFFTGNKTHGLWASMIQDWEYRWAPYY